VLQRVNTFAFGYSGTSLSMDKNEPFGSSICFEDPRCRRFILAGGSTVCIYPPSRDDLRTGHSPSNKEPNLILSSLGQGKCTGNSENRANSHSMAVDPLSPRDTRDQTQFACRVDARNYLPGLRHQRGENSNRWPFGEFHVARSFRSDVPRVRFSLATRSRAAELTSHSETLQTEIRQASIHAQTSLQSPAPLTFDADLLISGWIRRGVVG
jgi:hypothetical protein